MKNFTPEQLREFALLYIANAKDSQGVLHAPMRKLGLELTALLRR